MTLSVQKVREQDAAIDFKATLDSSGYEEELTTWLSKKSQTARIDGFRPGKAPLTVIRRLYSEEASRSVVNNLIDRVLRTIDKEHQIRVAGQPSISIEKADVEQGFECSVTVEYIPDIELKDFSEISCEELVVEISKKEVEEAVDSLFEHHQAFEKEPKDGVAAWGDKVNVFLHEKNGKTEDEATDFTLDKDPTDDPWIEAFKSVIGKKTGDKTEAVINFPQGYFNDSAAPVSHNYEIEVAEIFSPKIFKKDETFAKEFDCDSIDALHEKMRETLEKDHKYLTDLFHKRQILDALSAQYQFATPKSAIETEFKVIWGQLQAEIAAAQRRGEKDDMDLEEIRVEYKQIADRRVRLGLVVSEIAKQHDISLTNDDIQREVIKEAFKYPQSVKEVIDYFFKNRGALQRLVAAVLEDKVIEFVLSKAKKKQTKIASKDLPQKLKGIIPGYDDEDETLEASDSKTKKAQKESTSDSEKAPAKKASTKKKGE